MCPARGWGGIRPGTPELRVLLRGVSSQSPPPARLCWVPLSPGPGMCRWSLHKKVERDPGKSPALVRILLRELEKVGSRVWGRQTVAAGGGGRKRGQASRGPRPISPCPSTCSLELSRISLSPGLFSKQYHLYRDSHCWT